MEAVISEGTSPRPVPSAAALRLVRNAALVCAGAAVVAAVVGIAIGLAFGLANVWLVILGLGVSQVVLAVAALRESLRVQ